MSLPVPDPIETPWLRRGQRGGRTDLARPVQASSFRRDLVLTRTRAHCQRQSAGWNGQAGVRLIGQTGVNLGEVAIRSLSRQTWIHWLLTFGILIRSMAEHLCKYDLQWVRQKTEQGAPKHFIRANHNDLPSRQ